MENTLGYTIRKDSQGAYRYAIADHSPEMSDIRAEHRLQGWPSTSLPAGNAGKSQRRGG
ncbi:MAG: hypothetical protein R3E57_02905 [Porticoccaceae bacterium]